MIIVRVHRRKTRWLRSGGDEMFLDAFATQQNLWDETPEEVEAGLEWGRRKTELLKWIRREMGRRLTQRERRYVLLYFFKAMNYRSIAALDGCHPSTVHRDIRRALGKLKAAAQSRRPRPARG